MTLTPKLKRTLLIAAAVVLPAGGILAWWFWPRAADGDDGDDPADDGSSGDSAVTGSLQGNACAAATELLRAYPSAVLTSTLRDVSSQAHAMASNVVSNRQWISQTYVSSPVSSACQTWVDNNSDATTVDAISAGLVGILQAQSQTDLHRLSWHLTGQAFDVQPNSCPHDALTSLVSQHTSNGGTAKFLDKEGGLLRWHLQFDDSISTTFCLDPVIS